MPCRNYQYNSKLILCYCSAKKLLSPNMRFHGIQIPPHAPTYPFSPKSLVSASSPISQDSRSSSSASLKRPKFPDLLIRSKQEGSLPCSLPTDVSLPLHFSNYLILLPAEIEYCTSTLRLPQTKPATSKKESPSLPDIFLSSLLEVLWVTLQKEETCNSVFISTLLK